MAPRSTTFTTTTFLLLLVPITTRCFTPKVYKQQQQMSNGRTVTGVKLHHGGYMEVVQEEHCSEDDIRLTCRSFRAFVFILEAEHRSNSTDICAPTGLKKRKKNKRQKIDDWGWNFPFNRDTGYLNLTVEEEDEEEESPYIDLRASFNRRCSGLHHCRFTMNTDYSGSIHHWKPAGVYVKYACVPEAAVYKYCNRNIEIPGGEGGFLKSPAYPLYYIGHDPCQWIFKSSPGQRIVLTFHDLNIRGPESNDDCLDVVRVQENGTTLFEYCGTAEGIKIISNSHEVSLDLLASNRMYPARGFLLQYQVIGCPDVISPNGSYISNGTLTSRTFLCRLGTVFPDIKQRKRIIECKDGKWNETVDTLPACVATSSVILKAENEQNRVSSLSGDHNILEAGVRIGRGEDSFATGGPNEIMGSEPDVINVILPITIIALLFVGNAIIIYIIFQYRKRKAPSIEDGEEMTLKNSKETPRV